MPWLDLRRVPASCHDHNPARTTAGPPAGVWFGRFSLTHLANPGLGLDHVPLSPEFRHPFGLQRVLGEELSGLTLVLGIRE